MSDEAPSELKALVYLMARALVDKTDEVVVTEIKGQQSSVIELKVATSDIGKVIGKQGRTARSLRTIISSVAAKHRYRATLAIIE